MDDREFIFLFGILSGILAAILVVTILGATKQADKVVPGWHCLDDVKMYVPGRVRDGEAIVIWKDTGKLHYIPVGQLSPCT